MKILKELAIFIFSAILNLLFFMFGLAGLVIAPKWGSVHLFANLWYAGASISGSAGWILLLDAYVGCGRRFDPRFKVKLTTDPNIGDKITSVLPVRLFIQSKVYRAGFYAAALIVGRRWRKSSTIALLFEGFDFRKEATLLDWILAWSFVIPIIGILLMMLHSCLQWF